MKLTTVYSLLLLCSLQSLGQNFAPVGATWYYTQYDAIGPGISYTYFESLKDTIYNGIECRKIGGSGSGCAWSAEYVYDSNDSVFFWHPQREKFCLLYNFGAQVGDSWVVYHITSEFGGGIDSSIVEVDSLGSANIDGENLRIVYTSVLNSGENWWQVSGFTERIGGAYLFPVFGACDPVPGELRCYDDTVISFHQGVYDCDEVISSIAEAFSRKVVIYPNPLESLLSISLTPKIQDPVRIELFDVQGRLVFGHSVNFRFEEETIDLSLLGSGYYFLKLTTHSYPIHHTKILKL